MELFYAGFRLLFLLFTTTNIYHFVLRKLFLGHKTMGMVLLKVCTVYLKPLVQHCIFVSPPHSYLSFPPHRGTLNDTYLDCTFGKQVFINLLVNKTQPRSFQIYIHYTEPKPKVNQYLSEQQHIPLFL